MTTAVCPEVGPPEKRWGSTGGSRRDIETVVPWNRSVGALVGIFLTGEAGVLALVTVSVSSTDRWSEYLANVTGLAMLFLMLLLIASTRVEGVGDQLRVVDDAGASEPRLHRGPRPSTPSIPT